MDLVVKIPKDFITDYEATKFADCFKRIRCDINAYRKKHDYGMAGKYEDEIMDMLEIAFRSAEALPEGHGRLIYADDVNNHILGFVDLSSCPTIIKADKESAK